MALNVAERIRYSPSQRTRTNACFEESNMAWLAKRISLPGSNSFVARITKPLLVTLAPYRICDVKLYKGLGTEKEDYDGTLLWGGFGVSTVKAKPW